MFSSLFTLPLMATTALAAYSMVDDYEPDNFADKFNFFSGNDPTNGYVNYVDYNTAQSSGLYNDNNNQVYIGVDHNNTATGRGRDSVRIESKASYQHGLIIVDLAHMPGSVCGTWPAFWLLSTSAQWPNGGEVDIIEGVNTQNYNIMAAHTDAGCSISNTGGMSGELLTPNCDVNAPDQGTNQGCAIQASRTDSYGDGFNAVGGGVYATEWTSDGFSIWFFARSAVPSDIISGNPDPTGWGLPMARFAGACDWDEKVVNQQIMFDITFCGDWAGNTFSTDPTCSSIGSTCQAFVQDNPSAFMETYWSINSLKVYQQNGQAPVPTSSSVSVSIPATTTSTSVPATSASPSSLTSVTVPTTSASTTVSVSTATISTASETTTIAITTPAASTITSTTTPANTTPSAVS
ncbi:hypothetical protein LTR24_010349 [Lithohypha guttulata]|uniref:GH16 domain-containing protein n=1 Tax=Lithohypha guttulata TaxID=1690604 RepID=A0ABR0JU95_9EURO|nr:hypothetical protein LTR24_010349 [Lithohypha guttulata]